MSEHETYTFPPGARFTDNDGGLHDPTQAPSGGPRTIGPILFSSADLVGLGDTPKVVLAGVANVIHLPISYLTDFNPGNTPYGGSPQLLIGPANLAPGDYYGSLNVDFTSASRVITSQSSVGGLNNSPRASSVGSDLVVFGTGPTTGNGTLRLWVVVASIDVS